MVLHRLEQLRTAMTTLLIKISMEHYQGPKAQLFLLNNAHFISSRASRDEKDKWKDMYEKAVSEYIA